MTLAWSIINFAMDSSDNETKKPPNQFILYKKDVTESIVRKHGRLSLREVSKIAGQMWARETNETRQYYKKLATEKLNEHRERYPDFVWPSRSKSYAVRKKSSKSTSPTAPKAKSLSPRIQCASNSNIPKLVRSESSSPLLHRNRSMDIDFQTGWTPPPESIYEIIHRLNIQNYENAKHLIK
jgi:hypothetical protein